MTTTMGRKSRPDWKALCEVCFTDSQGVRYFKYIDELQIPIKRLQEMQTCLREIQNKTSDQDLLDFLDNHSKIIFGKETPEKKLEIIAKHASLLRERTEFSVATPDLLMSLTAHAYIREDENPLFVDDIVHKEKVIQFTKDSRGVLADFFYNAGLSGFLPFSSTTQLGIEKLLNLSSELSQTGKKMEQDISQVTG